MYFSSKIRGNIAVGHEFAPENMGIQAEQNAIQLTFGLYINIYCNSVCKYIYIYEHIQRFGSPKPPIGHIGSRFYTRH
jgi:coproporphyrinogen III oxidase-like Fe-S oxidoreductase